MIDTWCKKVSIHDDYVKQKYTIIVPTDAACNILYSEMNWTSLKKEHLFDNIYEVLTCNLHLMSINPSIGQNKYILCKDC